MRIFDRMDDKVAWTWSEQPSPHPKERRSPTRWAQVLPWECRTRQDRFARVQTETVTATAIASSKVMLSLTQELAEGVKLLIAMDCGDKCLYVPGLRRDNWP